MPDSAVSGFPQGGGEVGALMRAYDWSATPLGPPAGWAQSLKTTVSLLLHSPVPMVLLWGPDGIMIYNDAYSVFAGRRHPDLLGSKVLEGWPEVAAFNAHVMREGLSGRTLSFRNQELTLYRNGGPEDVWMNLDYSPVPDESGRPAGVLAIVVETTGRILAERRIAQESRRFREMFEQAPGLIAILSGPEHVFDLANAAYLELLGRPDVLGRPVREAVPELVAQGFVHLLDEVYRTGEAFVGREMPTVLERPGAEAETRYFDFVYQPITDGDGQVAAIFAEGHDVTEQVQSRLALQESETRFRLFSEQSREGVAVHDGRTILDCNSAYARLYGYARIEDVIGREITDTIAPESLAVLRANIEARSEKPVEAMARRRDGSTFPVETVAREATWRGQRVRIVLARDLTRTKQHEADLRAREAHLTAMFSQAAAGISECDTTGRFLRVNDRYCEIVGRPRQDLLGGLRMQEITHPDDLPANLALFRTMVEAGTPFEIEKRYLRPDGQVVWVNNSVTLVQDETGRSRTIVAVTIDVTARRQAEAALRESAEHQRLLINELNHRVKNTLATVQSIAGQTLRSTPDPAAARAAIEGRLIALSKAHDVLTRESWEGANLREVVERAIEPFRGQGEQRISCEGPPIRLSPRMALALSMALQELATNATKYGALSSPEGKIHIAWSITDADTGPRLRLAWRETAGPPVAPPTRKGFGSRLIERSLAQDLNGEVRIDYRPEGIVCTVEAPMDRAGSSLVVPTS